VLDFGTTMRWVVRYSESVTNREGSTTGVRDLVARLPLGWLARLTVGGGKGDVRLFTLECCECCLDGVVLVVFPLYVVVQPN
jgi:hypothetical protein